MNGTEIKSLLRDACRRYGTNNILEKPVESKHSMPSKSAVSYIEQQRRINSNNGQIVQLISELYRYEVAPEPFLIRQISLSKVTRDSVLTTTNDLALSRQSEVIMYYTVVPSTGLLSFFKACLRNAEILINQKCYHPALFCVLGSLWSSLRERNQRLQELLIETESLNAALFPNKNGSNVPLMVQKSIITDTLLDYILACPHVPITDGHNLKKKIKQHKYSPLPEEIIEQFLNFQEARVLTASCEFHLILEINDPKSLESAVGPDLSYTHTLSTEISDVTGGQPTDKLSAAVATKPLSNLISHPPTRTITIRSELQSKLNVIISAMQQVTMIDREDYYHIIFNCTLIIYDLCMNYLIPLACSNTSPLTRDSYISLDRTTGKLVAVRPKKDNLFQDAATYLAFAGRYCDCILPLATTHYLTWRVQIYTAICKCYELQCDLYGALHVSRYIAFKVRELYELEVQVDVIQPTPEQIRELDESTRLVRVLELKYTWACLQAEYEGIPSPTVEEIGGFAIENFQTPSYYAREQQRKIDGLIQASQSKSIMDGVTQKTQSQNKKNKDSVKRTNQMQVAAETETIVDPYAVIPQSASDVMRLLDAALNLPYPRNLEEAAKNAFTQSSLEHQYGTYGSAAQNSTVTIQRIPTLHVSQHLALLAMLSPEGASVLQSTSPSHREALFYHGVNPSFAANQAMKAIGAACQEAATKTARICIQLGEQTTISGSTTCNKKNDNSSSGLNFDSNFSVACPHFCLDPNLLICVVNSDLKDSPAQTTNSALTVTLPTLLPGETYSGLQLTTVDTLTTKFDLTMSSSKSPEPNMSSCKSLLRFNMIHLYIAEAISRLLGVAADDYLQQKGVLNEAGVLMTPDAAARSLFVSPLRELSGNDLQGGLFDSIVCHNIQPQGIVLYAPISISGGFSALHNAASSVLSSSIEMANQPILEKGKSRLKLVQQASSASTEQQQSQLCVTVVQTLLNSPLLGDAATLQDLLYKREPDVARGPIASLLNTMYVKPVQEDYMVSNHSDWIKVLIAGVPLSDAPSSIPSYQDVVKNNLLPLSTLEVLFGLGGNYEELTDDNVISAIKYIKHLMKYGFYDVALKMALCLKHGINKANAGKGKDNIRILEVDLLIAGIDLQRAVLMSSSVPVASTRPCMGRGSLHTRFQIQQQNQAVVTGVTTASKPSKGDVQSTMSAPGEGRYVAISPDCLYSSSLTRLFGKTAVSHIATITKALMSLINLLNIWCNYSGNESTTGNEVAEETSLLALHVWTTVLNCGSGSPSGSVEGQKERNHHFYFFSDMLSQSMTARLPTAGRIITQGKLRVGSFIPLYTSVWWQYLTTMSPAAMSDSSSSRDITSSLSTNTPRDRSQHGDHNSTTEHPISGNTLEITAVKRRRHEEYLAAAHAVFATQGAPTINTDFRINADRDIPAAFLPSTSVYHLDRYKGICRALTRDVTCLHSSDNTDMAKEGPLRHLPFLRSERILASIVRYLLCSQHDNLLFVGALGLTVIKMLIDGGAARMHELPPHRTPAEAASELNVSTPAIHENTITDRWTAYDYYQEALHIARIIHDRLTVAQARFVFSHDKSGVLIHQQKKKSQDKGEGAISTVGLYENGKMERLSRYIGTVAAGHHSLCHVEGGTSSYIGLDSAKTQMKEKHQDRELNIHLYQSKRIYGTNDIFLNRNRFLTSVTDDSSVWLRQVKDLRSELALWLIRLRIRTAALKHLDTNLTSQNEKIDFLHNRRNNVHLYGGITCRESRALTALYEEQMNTPTTVAQMEDKLVAWANSMIGPKKTVATSSAALSEDIAFAQNADGTFGLEGQMTFCNKNEDILMKRHERKPFDNFCFSSDDGFLLLGMIYSELAPLQPTNRLRHAKLKLACESFILAAEKDNRVTSALMPQWRIRGESESPVVFAADCTTAQGYSLYLGWCRLAEVIGTCAMVFNSVGMRNQKESSINNIGVQDVYLSYLREYKILDVIKTRYTISLSSRNITNTDSWYRDTTGVIPRDLVIGRLGPLERQYLVGAMRVVGIYERFSGLLALQSGKTLKYTPMGCYEDGGTKASKEQGGEQTIETPVNLLLGELTSSGYEGMCSFGTLGRKVTLGGIVEGWQLNGENAAEDGHDNRRYDRIRELHLHCLRSANFIAIACDIALIDDMERSPSPPDIINVIGSHQNFITSNLHTSLHTHQSDNCESFNVIGSNALRRLTAASVSADPTVLVPLAIELYQTIEPLLESGTISSFLPSVLLKPLFAIFNIISKLVNSPSYACWTDPTFQLISAKAIMAALQCASQLPEKPVLGGLSNFQDGTTQTGKGKIKPTQQNLATSSASMSQQHHLEYTQNQPFSSKTAVYAAVVNVFCEVWAAIKKAPNQRQIEHMLHVRQEEMFVHRVLQNAAIRVLVERSLERQQTQIGSSSGTSALPIPQVGTSSVIPSQLGCIFNSINSGATGSCFSSVKANSSTGALAEKQSQTPPLSGRVGNSKPGVNKGKLEKNKEVLIPQYVTSSTQPLTVAKGLLIEFETCVAAIVQSGIYASISGCEHLHPFSVSLCNPYNASCTTDSAYDFYHNQKHIIMNSLIDFVGATQLAVTRASKRLLRLSGTNQFTDQFALIEDQGTVFAGKVNVMEAIRSLLSEKNETINFTDHFSPTFDFYGQQQLIHFLRQNIFNHQDIMPVEMLEILDYILFNAPTAASSTSSIATLICEAKQQSHMIAEVPEVAFAVDQHQHQISSEIMGNMASPLQEGGSITTSGKKPANFGSTEMFGTLPSNTVLSASANAILRQGLSPSGSSTKETLFPPCYLAVAGAIRSLVCLGASNTFSTVKGTIPVSLLVILQNTLSLSDGQARVSNADPNTTSVSGTVSIINPIRDSLQNCTTLFNAHPYGVALMTKKDNKKLDIAIRKQYLGNATETQGTVPKEGNTTTCFTEPNQFHSPFSYLFPFVAKNSGSLSIQASGTVSEKSGKGDKQKSGVGTSSAGDSGAFGMATSPINSPFLTNTSTICTLPFLVAFPNITTLQSILCSPIQVGVGSTSTYSTMVPIPSPDVLLSYLAHPLGGADPIGANAIYSWLIQPPMWAPNKEKLSNKANELETSGTDSITITIDSPLKRHNLYCADVNGSFAVIALIVRLFEAKRISVSQCASSANVSTQLEGGKKGMNHNPHSPGTSSPFTIPNIDPISGINTTTRVQTPNSGTTNINKKDRFESLGIGGSLGQESKCAAQMAATVPSGNFAKALASTLNPLYPKLAKRVASILFERRFYDAALFVCLHTLEDIFYRHSSIRANFEEMFSLLQHERESNVQLQQMYFRNASSAIVAAGNGSLLQLAEISDKNDASFKSLVGTGRGGKGGPLSVHDSDGCFTTLSSGPLEFMLKDDYNVSAIGAWPERRDNEIASPNYKDVINESISTPNITGVSNLEGLEVYVEGGHNGRTSAALQKAFPNLTKSVIDRALQKISNNLAYIRLRQATKKLFRRHLQYAVPFQADLLAIVSSIQESVLTFHMQHGGGMFDSCLMSPVHHSFSPKIVIKPPDITNTKPPLSKRSAPQLRKNSPLKIKRSMGSKDEIDPKIGGNSLENPVIENMYDVTDLATHEPQDRSQHAFYDSYALITSSGARAMNLACRTYRPQRAYCFMQQLTTTLEHLLGSELPDCTGDAIGYRRLGPSFENPSSPIVPSSMGSARGRSEISGSRVPQDSNPTTYGTRLTSTALCSLSAVPNKTGSVMKSSGQDFMVQPSRYQPVWISGGPLLSSYGVSLSCMQPSQVPQLVSPPVHFVEVACPAHPLYYHSIIEAICKYTERYSRMLSVACLELLQRHQVAEPCMCSGKIATSSTSNNSNATRTSIIPFDSFREIEFDQPVAVKIGSMCGPFMVNTNTLVGSNCTPEAVVIGNILSSIYPSTEDISNPETSITGTIIPPSMQSFYAHTTSLRIILSPEGQAQQQLREAIAVINESQMRRIFQMKSDRLKSEEAEMRYQLVGHDYFSSLIYNLSTAGLLLDVKKREINRHDNTKCDGSQCVSLSTLPISDTGTPLDGEYLKPLDATNILCAAETSSKFDNDVYILGRCYVDNVMQEIKMFMEMKCYADVSNTNAEEKYGDHTSAVQKQHILPPFSNNTGTATNKLRMPTQINDKRHCSSTERHCFIVSPKSDTDMGRLSLYVGDVDIMRTVVDPKSKRPLPSTAPVVAPICSSSLAIALSVPKDESIFIQRLGRYILQDEIINTFVYSVMMQQYCSRKVSCIPLITECDDLTHQNFSQKLVPISCNFLAATGSRYEHLVKHMKDVSNRVPRSIRLFREARRLWRVYMYTESFRNAQMKLSATLLPASNLNSKGTIDREIIYELPIGRPNCSLSEIYVTAPADDITITTSSGTFGRSNNGLKFVVSCYNTAIDYFRQKHSARFLTASLYELGYIYIIHRMKNEAEETWLSAVDVALGTVDSLKEWQSVLRKIKVEPEDGEATLPSNKNSVEEDFLDGIIGERKKEESSDLALKKIGFINTIRVVGVLTALAMFIYPERQTEATNACLFAAELLALISEVGLTSVGISGAGRRGFVSSKYACRGQSGTSPSAQPPGLHTVIPQVLNQTLFGAQILDKEFISLLSNNALYGAHHLVQRKYYISAAIMTNLSEVLGMSAVRSTETVICSRIIRAKCAAGVCDFKSALEWMTMAARGECIPNEAGLAATPHSSSSSQFATLTRDILPPFYSTVAADHVLHSALAALLIPNVGASTTSGVQDALNVSGLSALSAIPNVVGLRSITNFIDQMSILLGRDTSSLQPVSASGSGLPVELSLSGETIFYQNGRLQSKSNSGIDINSAIDTHSTTLSSKSGSAALTNLMYILSSEYDNSLPFQHTRNIAAVEAFIRLCVVVPISSSSSDKEGCGNSATLTNILKSAQHAVKEESATEHSSKQRSTMSAQYTAPQSTPPTSYLLHTEVLKELPGGLCLQILQGIAEVLIIMASAEPCACWAHPIDLFVKEQQAEKQNENGLHYQVLDEGLRGVVATVAGTSRDVYPLNTIATESSSIVPPQMWSLGADVNNQNQDNRFGTNIVSNTTNITSSLLAFAQNQSGGMDVLGNAIYKSTIKSINHVTAAATQQKTPNHPPTGKGGDPTTVSLEDHLNIVPVTALLGQGNASTLNTRQRAGTDGISAAGKQHPSLSSGAITGAGSAVNSVASLITARDMLNFFLFLRPGDENPSNINAATVALHHAEKLITIIAKQVPYTPLSTDPSLQQMLITYQNAQEITQEVTSPTTPTSQKRAVVRSISGSPLGAGVLPMTVNGSISFSNLQKQLQALSDEQILLQEVHPSFRLILPSAVPMGYVRESHVAPSISSSNFPTGKDFAKGSRKYGLSKYPCVQFESESTTIPASSLAGITYGEMVYSRRLIIALLAQIWYLRGVDSKVQEYCYDWIVEHNSEDKKVVNTHNVPSFLISITGYFIADRVYGTLYKSLYRRKKYESARLALKRAHQIAVQINDNRLQRDIAFQTLSIDLREGRLHTLKKEADNLARAVIGSAYQKTFECGLGQNQKQCKVEKKPVIISYRTEDVTITCGILLAKLSIDDKLMTQTKDDNDSIVSDETIIETLDFLKKEVVCHLYDAALDSGMEPHIIDEISKRMRRYSPFASSSLFKGDTSRYDTSLLTHEEVDECLDAILLRREKMAAASSALAAEMKYKENEEHRQKEAIPHAVIGKKRSSTPRGSGNRSPNIFHGEPGEREHAVLPPRKHLHVSDIDQVMKDNTKCPTIHLINSQRYYSTQRYNTSLQMLHKVINIMADKLLALHQLRFDKENTNQLKKYERKSHHKSQNASEQSTKNTLKCVIKLLSRVALLQCSTQYYTGVQVYERYNSPCPASSSSSPDGMLEMGRDITSSKPLPAHDSLPNLWAVLSAHSTTPRTHPFTAALSSEPSEAKRQPHFLSLETIKSRFLLSVALRRLYMTENYGASTCDTDLSQDSKNHATLLQDILPLTNLCLPHTFTEEFLVNQLQIPEWVMRHFYEGLTPNYFYDRISKKIAKIKELYELEKSLKKQRELAGVEPLSKNLQDGVLNDIRPVAVITQSKGEKVPKIKDQGAIDAAAAKLKLDLEASAEKERVTNLYDKHRSEWYKEKILHLKHRLSNAGEISTNTVYRTFEETLAVSIQNLLLDTSCSLSTVEKSLFTKVSNMDSADKDAAVSRAKRGVKNIDDVLYALLTPQKAVSSAEAASPTLLTALPIEAVKQLMAAIFSILQGGTHDYALLLSCLGELKEIFATSAVEKRRMFNLSKEDIMLAAISRNNGGKRRKKDILQEKLNIAYNNLKTQLKAYIGDKISSMMKGATSGGPSMVSVETSDSMPITVALLNILVAPQRQLNSKNVTVTGSPRSVTGAPRADSNVPAVEDSHMEQELIMELLVNIPENVRSLAAEVSYLRKRQPMDLLGDVGAHNGPVPRTIQHPMLSILDNYVAQCSNFIGIVNQIQYNVFKDPNRQFEGYGHTVSVPYALCPYVNDNGLAGAGSRDISSSKGEGTVAASGNVSGEAKSAVYPSNTNPNIPIFLSMTDILPVPIIEDLFELERRDLQDQVNFASKYCLSTVPKGVIVSPLDVDNETALEDILLANLGSKPAEKRNIIDGSPSSHPRDLNSTVNIPSSSNKSFGAVAASVPIQSRVGGCSACNLDETIAVAPKYASQCNFYGPPSQGSILFTSLVRYFASLHRMSGSYGLCIDPVEQIEIETKLAHVVHVLQQQQLIRILASIPASAFSALKCDSGGCVWGASNPPPSSLLVPSMAQMVYHMSSVTVSGEGCELFQTPHVAGGQQTLNAKLSDNTSVRGHSRETPQRVVNDRLSFNKDVLTSQDALNFIQWPLPPAAVLSASLLFSGPLNGNAPFLAPFFAHHPSAASSGDKLVDMVKDRITSATGGDCGQDEVGDGGHTINQKKNCNVSSVAGANTSTHNMPQINSTLTNFPITIQGTKKGLVCSLAAKLPFWSMMMRHLELLEDPGKKKASIVEGGEITWQLITSLPAEKLLAPECCSKIVKMIQQSTECKNMKAIGTPGENQVPNPVISGVTSSHCISSNQVRIEVPIRETTLPNSSKHDQIRPRGTDNDTLSFSANAAAIEEHAVEVLKLVKKLLLDTLLQTILFKLPTAATVYTATVMSTPEVYGALEAKEKSNLIDKIATLQAANTGNKRQQQGVPGGNQTECLLNLTIPKLQSIILGLEQSLDNSSPVVAPTTSSKNTGERLGNIALTTPSIDIFDILRGMDDTKYLSGEIGENTLVCPSLGCCASFQTSFSVPVTLNLKQSTIRNLHMKAKQLAILGSVVKRKETGHKATVNIETVKEETQHQGTPGKVSANQRSELVTMNAHDGSPTQMVTPYHHLLDFLIDGCIPAINGFTAPTTGGSGKDVHGEGKDRSYQNTNNSAGIHQSSRSTPNKKSRSSSVSQSAREDDAVTGKVITTETEDTLAKNKILFEDENLMDSFFSSASSGSLTEEQFAEALTNLTLPQQQQLVEELRVGVVVGFVDMIIDAVGNDAVEKVFGVTPSNWSRNDSASTIMDKGINGDESGMCNRPRPCALGAIQRERRVYGLPVDALSKARQALYPSFTISVAHAVIITKLLDVKQGLLMLPTISASRPSAFMSATNGNQYAFWNANGKDAKALTSRVAYPFTLELDDECNPKSPIHEVIQAVPPKKSIVGDKPLRCVNKEKKSDFYNLSISSEGCNVQEDVFLWLSTISSFVQEALE